jgi:hypothetical protein
LTSALDAGAWSASRPGRFTAGEGAPGTHLIGGWMDPKTGLDAVEKKPSSKKQQQNEKKLKHMNIFMLWPLYLRL